MSVRPVAYLLAAGCAHGLSGAGFAQDSIGLTTTTNGLPGDAPSAWQAGSLAPPNDSRQVLRYSIDLTPKSSSWGGVFAIGPAVKSSKSNSSGFFSQLIGAQTVSNRFGSGQFFSAANYATWFNAPTVGINPPHNVAPSLFQNGAFMFGSSFGLGFMEFGAGPDGALGTSDDENSLVGAVLNFQTRDVNRLFVTRVVAAQNKFTTTAAGTASFGLGAIDESGNLHALADGFGMTSGAALNQRYLVRFNLAARTATSVNNIFQNGANLGAGNTAATTSVRADTTPMTVPGIISSKVAGGLNRPVMLSSDLLNNFVAETSAGSTTLAAGSAYLPAGSGPRGSISFVPQAFAPVNTASTDIGTCATLARTDSNTKTRAIEVFGVSSAGVIDNKLNVPLPTSAAAVVDPIDSFSPGAAFSPITNHEFTNYQSQASFRGGTSQVAMTVLANGDLLAASLVSATGGGSSVPQGQDNYIAVAHIPASGAGTTWTVAAHTGNSSGFAGGLSKAILGRANPGDPLTTIGRLARYSEVFGTATTGPSISSPAMDPAGNVYFMATIALTGSGTTYTSGLLRANRNSANDGYQLELLAAVGDVVAGINSGRSYQIQYLGIADADSVDSGSIFSSSIVQDSIIGANAAGAPYGSPMSLGAIAFKAKIVYDVDNDSLFSDPSGTTSSSTSPDQAYDAVMVVMPRVIPADFNRDGVVSIDDLFIYINSWLAGAIASDWNGDGSVSIDDLFIYINAWLAA